MRKFLLSISIFSVISSVSYAQSFNIQETYRNLNGFNNFENQNQLGSQNKKLIVDSIYESHLSNNFENTTRIFKPVINFPSKNKFIPKSNLNEGNNKEFQKEKLSTIENLFNHRIESENETIRQFGYDFFSGYPNLYLSAPVDESYVLGPGDELFLYVIGTPPGIDLGKVVKLVVDREGRIYIPRIGVFYVWGKTLKETEKIISSSVGANIKLTVGKLRTFPVYVSGDVKRPGAVVVTALNTVIDAIMMAGGIKKDGTLRDVIITRRTSKGLKRIHIDFYRLLLEGEPVDMRLKDGDVIFVHSIGKVAGIVGKVKRPAIYELKSNETVSDLIKMAGGLLPSSYCSRSIHGGHPGVF
ncbi:protein involved in polysaccharide export, contains SLBB domain of the beta-grasp fold [Balnearium lithotrophicum]|uniref:Protein involved in polysaccharide export, contains SLBB domain of the beta-grasp fold n=1 Tax=Balnearium lithotrophicum TaxID=223788 RepID=A0A521BP79_9BACT|nr:protein involved in polysaccharide export, contains SLBB domain of the beta-grasp fold [Balnearium lithotrophicum]